VQILRRVHEPPVALRPAAAQPDVDLARVVLVRPQLPAGFEHLESCLRRDAHDADVVVGDRRDQPGHGGAVAQ